MPVYQNTVPRTCRQGDKNSAVSFLQACLNRAGLKADATGNMDTNTVSLLRVFQCTCKLTDDGICGPKSWEALLNGDGKIIHYMQNDPRWKNTVYTSSNDLSQTIGNSGCGPTSLAIALSGYGVSVTPPELCKSAVQGGFRTANNGTSWSFFAPVAAKYAQKVIQTSSIVEIIKALGNGSLVVASMGAGDYTKSGHYICIRDYDSYADIFYTFDPISNIRNCCSKNVIQAQSKQYWIVGLGLTVKIGDTEFTLESAVNKLVKEGIITSPDYWLRVSSNIKYLEQLIINIAIVNKKATESTDNLSITQALDKLSDIGIINSPDYWKQNHSLIQWLDVLLLKVAKRV